MGVTSKPSAKPSNAFSFLLVAVLMLLALPAWALGLGQLQVKSKPGEPLLAEIPVISSDPSELENLQARLASPDTFRRVGLEPPGSEVTGLQFAVALDARGNPVIRVTSAAPLRQAQLTFLLEVDWGDGRLVREYSALVDTPSTVAAPIQPVQAPTVAPSNNIVRPPAVAASPAPRPVPVTPPPGERPSEPTAAAPSAPVAVAPPPPVPATAIAPSAPPRVATTPAPAPSMAGEYRVRSGDTLNQIARGIDHGDHSLAQTMLALLRANPDAFINDNINMVKAGAVLRMPRGDELSRYSASEAAAVVRTQIAQWRQIQAPQRQPETTPRTASTATAASQGNGNATPTSAGARLEIVPPSSGAGQRAGTRSGIASGGEGDMEQQQLQQTKETLAARDAEVQELKSRVAELEKLQAQQQQLIEMKDSALATAQQNLAKSNDGQATTQQPAKPTDSSSGPWLWSGLGLLVLALLAWLMMRGRRNEAPARTRRFDIGAFAENDREDNTSPVVTEDQVTPDEYPPPVEASTDPEVDELAETSVVTETLPEDEPPAAYPDVAEPVQPPHWTAAPALVGTVPTWHGGVPGQSSTTETDDDNPEGESPARQIELASAYLDMGDDDAARALLLEVLDGRDPAARETAARMLRDL